MCVCQMLASFLNICHNSLARLFPLEKGLSFRNHCVCRPVCTYAPLYRINTSTRIVFKKHFFPYSNRMK